MSAPASLSFGNSASGTAPGEAIMFSPVSSRMADTMSRKFS